jgi:hypothetical protein
MGHETGQHDDNIFSHAMAWTRGHDIENMAEKMGSWFSLNPPKDDEEVDMGWAEQVLVLDGYDGED